jgi:hypothetical protein
VNSPDWKVISSILAGWGCLAQAGRSSRTASRTADSLVKVCLLLEMIWVFIVNSLVKTVWVLALLSLIDESVICVVLTYG